VFRAVTMNAARVFLTVAAGGWLAGCQSVRARRLATNQDALKAGNAIVVISTSADEGCFRFSQVDVFPANGVSPEAAIPLNHSGLKSDFADHVGFFDAFILKPGNYVLRVVSGAGEINPDLQFRVRPEAARFRLDAGEIRYVGDVHVAGCSRPLPEMRDAWASVRPGFIVRFPGLDVTRIISPSNESPPHQP
jgi:hypothetical protein